LQQIILEDSDNYQVSVEASDKNLYHVIACLIPFTVIALITGNKGYELTQSEKEYLAPLWEDLFLKYLPAMYVFKYDKEITLTTTIIGLVIKKYLQPVKLLHTQDPEPEENNTKVLDR